MAGGQGGAQRAGLEELLPRVPRCVIQIRELLQHPNPQVLELCAPQLEEAAGYLRQMRDEGGSGGSDPALRARVSELRRDIRKLGASLETCATFYHGWLKILTGLTGGYTRNGAALQPEPGMRIFTHG